MGLTLVSGIMIVFGLIGCGKTDGAEDGFVPSVTVYSTTVDYKASSQFIKVETGTKTAWTLKIEYEDGSEGWAHLSQSEGIGTKSGITLSWEANNTDLARTLQLKLTCGKVTASASMKQNPEFASETVVSEVPSWLELPAIKDTTLIFVIHNMTQNEKTVRNYSLLWDTDALVSHWVAYPLNAGLISGGSRTENWNYDPSIPQSKQPKLFKGFSGGAYDRGHQIPSADRLDGEANQATFYFTNMTPQIGRNFNQSLWANLEGQVRTWSRAFDTLYVVTGCLVKGSINYAYDNEGKVVTVPAAYYKALLGYKKNGTLGKTGVQSGYTATGFYFDHVPYSQDYDYINGIVTIDELEKKTGEDFFPNLLKKIGKNVSDKIESTSDEYWSTR